jgi:glycosyltransferase involved in cell wall biosynthesis
VIIPAKNEAASIPGVIQGVRRVLPDAQVLVINDGSVDETAQLASGAGAQVISHRRSIGNGAAIKTGVRAASGDIIVLMDADGQHDPNDILRLLDAINEGCDMVVGNRSNDAHASFGRGLANRLYNRLASYMTGQKILDLTSGFRAARIERFREFLHLLPNGFSYPTTITMPFFRAGYSVDYVPITAAKRVGKSHIRPVQDGIRFLLIIFRIGTLYSPLKLFFPLAVLHGAFGLGYYAYTYTTDSRLSVATIFMLTAAVTIFLIGLVSEQITMLMYKDAGKDSPNS